MARGRVVIVMYLLCFTICVLMFMYYTVCYFYWYLLCSPKANLCHSWTVTILYSIIGWSCHKYGFCRDKHVSRQKYTCRDKTFVSTNICRHKHVCLSHKSMLVATNTCIGRDKHNFVATKVLSRQAYFCRDKRCMLSPQTRVCPDKKN